MSDLHDYLNTKGIEYATRGKELVARCLFSDCDDGRASVVKSHLYFNIETGQYHCKKCNSSGNMKTLAKHFGDSLDSEFKRNPSVGKVTKKDKEKDEVKVTNEDVENWHTALPEDISSWLQKERGISAEVISQARLGWHRKKVIIPVKDKKGEWSFVKRRKSPHDASDAAKYTYQKGSNAELYGAYLLDGNETVVICEGELDALVLRSRAFVAVSSTGGAGTFNASWAKYFEDIPNVYIVFDNDDAGVSGALRAGRLIPHAKIATLPSEIGKGGDVTDYFMKLGNSVDDFYTLIQTGKTAKEIDEEGTRFDALPKPDSETTIEKWRELIKGNFPECLMAAEVGVSALTQLLIKDVRNPFGLVYVDVPSAGKTITLNFFADLPEIVYTTDNFTPASLVSHASNRSAEDLESIDMLPRIRHKMLIVRDMAPLFAERQEALLKNLGVLTRVFDGEGYESDSGVHGKRGYKGDYTFMFLAGSTPIKLRVWKFMGSLGSRLFFLNLDVGDKSEEELADLLVASDFKKKEDRCKKETRNLVLTLWKKFEGGVEWDKQRDPIELRRIIARCAQLLSCLRGSVSFETEGEDGSNENIQAVIEKPMRINQLLYNLARGHALACGRTNITEDDMWPVIEVTVNSAQRNRIQLLQLLIANEGEADTKLVEAEFDCSNPTALKEMDTFGHLGLAYVISLSKNKVIAASGRPMKSMKLKNEYIWFCSEECTRLRALRPGVV